jgi:hypothetical protein
LQPVTGGNDTMANSSNDRPIAHDLSCINPDLMVDPRMRQVMILAELVAFHPTAHPSGTNIRLGMTAEDAMRLLALLLGVQQQLGLPVPQVVSSLHIPGKKDQN